MSFFWSSLRLFFWDYNYLIQLPNVHKYYLVAYTRMNEYYYMWKCRLNNNDLCKIINVQWALTKTITVEKIPPLKIRWSKVRLWQLLLQQLLTGHLKLIFPLNRLLKQLRLIVFIGNSPDVTCLSDRNIKNEDKAIHVYAVKFLIIIIISFKIYIYLIYNFLHPYK